MAESRTIGISIGRADSADAAHLAAVLSELGIEAAFDGDLLTVEAPSVAGARRMRTRNAGPKRRYLDLPDGSPLFEEMTCAAFLDWLDEHTAAEAMAALGLASRSTYFRRLRDIREIAEEDADTPLWMV